MFTHTLSKLLADKGLTSETKWFYVETEITGSDEEDDWFAENGVPDYDFTLQYHDDGLDGATPAFNFLDLLNKENAVKLFGEGKDHIFTNNICDTCGLNASLWGGSWCVEPYNIVLHNLVDTYLLIGEQAVEARLVEMLKG